MNERISLEEIIRLYKIDHTFLDQLIDSELLHPQTENSIRYIIYEELATNPHYDTDTMETNITGIYLAGVVCGGRDTHLWFIENFRIHAKQIISNIIQKKESEKIPE